MPPQIGEVRKGATETVQWDGSRWQPIQQDSNVPLHHPSSTETPGEAFMGELGRTAGEAGKGLLHSPIDLLSSLVHPIETIKSTASAIAHPIDTVKNLADNPRAAGSLLGQLLLGKAVPGAASAALEGAPGALSSVGRGLEAAGTSAPARYLSKMGMMEGALRMDPKGLIVAGAPKGMELAGRGLQNLGESWTASREAAAAPPVPSHGEMMAEGADKYARLKKAAKLQDEAAQGASNVTDLREPVPQDVMPNVTPDWTVGSEANPTPGESYNRGLVDSGFSQKMVNKLGEPAEPMFPNDVSSLRKAAAQTTKPTPPPEPLPFGLEPGSFAGDRNVPPFSELADAMLPKEDLNSTLAGLKMAAEQADYADAAKRAKAQASEDAFNKYMRNLGGVQ